MPLKDMREYDVVVIGGGPAGMAAAVAASDQGAEVCLLERKAELGGILNQCIHDGFGLIRFGEQLTGPEYAARYDKLVRERPVEIMTDSYLTALEPLSQTKNGPPQAAFGLTVVNPAGLSRMHARALIMAMGCRERTDRQVFIHGDRPAGIFTAGQAQDLINLKGYLPGKNCVILGSGDIGLIMARRLTLEGAAVEGVYEIGSEASGLNRNIAQCLEDFGIPLHLQTTVQKVHGRKRVEGVTVARLENGRPAADSERFIPCDTLILSVGLIPENDILFPLAPEMDARTRGPAVDQYRESSLDGVFSCGNALHVNDLVDYVSECGETAGKAAARRALSQGDEGTVMGDDAEVLRIEARGNLAYVLPQRLRLPAGEGIPFFFRVKKSASSAVLEIRQNGALLVKKKYAWLKASEMERLVLEPELFGGGSDVEVKMTCGEESE